VSSAYILGSQLIEQLGRPLIYSKNNSGPKKIRLKSFPMLEIQQPLSVIIEEEKAMGVKKGVFS